MDSFKAALKEAIKRRAIVVLFEAGNVPVLELDSGEKDPLSHLLVVDENSISSYYDVLFRAESELIGNNQPAKGSLSIVNFGEMSLIAEPNRKSLYVFVPPRGLERFQEVWDTISSESGNPNRVHPNFDPLADLSDIGLAKGAVELDKARDDEEQSVHDHSSHVIPDQSPPSELESGIDSEIGISHDSMPSFTPRDSLTPFSMFDQNYDDVLPLSFPDDHKGEGGNPVYQEYSQEDKKEELFLEQDGPRMLDEIGVSQKVSSQYHVPDPNGEIALADSGALDPPALGHDLLNQSADMPTTVFSPVSHSVPSPPPIREAEMATETNSSPRIIFDSELPNSTVSPGDYPINRLLNKMVQMRASDMHLTVSQPVVLRIDGDIKRLDSDSVGSARMEELLLPIIPAMHKDSFILTNDCDFSYDLRDVGRFRVNIFRDRNGVGAVLRQIPTRVLTADELGLSEPIRRLCQLSKGLVLVTGPTGSGKSTTLAAMIDLINTTRSEHILTIEDPIEYIHIQKQCLVNQREVHSHTNSFSSALRAALREDPDILMVGEMRDLETVAMAIETAETGHLVFGTLHTTTAVSTIDRIIDQFPEAQQNQVRSMLANSLKGVISQVLLKKKVGGRVAAHEIMIVSHSISSLIRENKIHMIQNDMQTKRTGGNQLMHDALFKLIKDGVVEPEVAIRKSTAPDEFKSLLSSKGISVA